MCNLLLLPFFFWLLPDRHIVGIASTVLATSVNMASHNALAVADEVIAWITRVKVVIPVDLERFVVSWGPVQFAAAVDIAGL